MKKRRTNPFLRALALALVLAAGAAGFWATLVTLYKWDDIWTGAGYYSSNDYYSGMHDSSIQVREMAALLQSQKWNGKLSYLDEQRLNLFQQNLEPENTNFRVRLLDNTTGELLYTNLPLTTSREALERAVHGVVYSSWTLRQNAGMSENDYTSWDDENQVNLLHVFLPSWDEAVYPPEQAVQAEEYGWRYLSEYGEWSYREEKDSRIKAVELALEYGVTDPMRVDDIFMEGYREYGRYAQYMPAVALSAVGLDILAVLAATFLCAGAGWRRGRDTLALGWLDRVPLDLLAVVMCFAVMCLLAAGDSMGYALGQSSVGGTVHTETLVGLLLVSMGICGCVLASVLTLAVRYKTKTLASNTLVWRLWHWLGLSLQKAVASWPLVWRAAAGFALYLAGTFLTAVTVFLIPLYQGMVLFALCRWCLQWRQVREGSARIMGGEPGFRIDTGGHMYRDLREHAEQINDLGGAISSAVEEQLKSERFKAELITNVSHDLKTPLTSIINYVDLLKKREIQDPAAVEYIAVLDRKSQRLKKLTEDLVEASKASTGNLAVNTERLGMVQLVQQAVGEFEEKFAQSGLTLVSTFPPEEVYVQADGRHLWRIVENLLSNCNKYAMAGTRVYLDLTRWEGNVIFSVKNISRQQLNIPAERLMERFVRGEESRSTEGSGLGLSIARSLAELQGGTFRLDIDGDLFKAAVSLPEDRGKLEGSAALPGLPEKKAF